MNGRNLNEGQWEDRKQWSLGVGQRRNIFWNRHTYITTTTTTATTSSSSSSSSSALNSSVDLLLIFFGGGRRMPTLVGKDKQPSAMPYVLTSQSGFATEETWINAGCKYDFSSLCFTLQYYACQCSKKSARFLTETKNGNHPLPLEINTISCTVKLGLISSLWELPTVKMEPQRHLKCGPFFGPRLKSL
jgi:hypothetical protein